MRNKELDFSFEHVGRDRHIHVGLANISVPFRNFILENAVIAKGVPSEPADMTVVLVRVLPPVSEDEFSKQRDCYRKLPGVRAKKRQG